MSSVPFEKIVEEDVNYGTGEVQVTMPAGGTSTGHQINPSSQQALAFSAAAPGSQVIAGGAAVAIVELNSEDFDTKAWFAAHAFTPQKPGYYQINAFLQLAALTGSCIVGIYKNTTLVMQARTVEAAAIAEVALSALVALDGSTDFVVIKVNHDDGANNRTVSAARMSGACVGGL